MTLADSIVKRKSFRSFSEKELEPSVMDELVDFISDLTPPMEDIDWNFDTLPYVDMVKISSREPGVKAPFYLVLRAERKNFSLQKAGYIGELAALYLTSKGIATCWQGSLTVTRESDYHDSLPFVSALAFGYSEEAFRNSAQEFDRKPISKVAFGKYQDYISIVEAGRLAPSSYNRQPCIFVADDKQRIHLYRKKNFMSNPVTNYAHCVDAGAALAHLELAAKEAGYKPVIDRYPVEPKFKSFIYQATIELS